MLRVSHLLIIFLFSILFARGSEKPNIVFVLCDDLGYGDIQCLNPTRGKILTPAVDRLAREGMVFTDAHSGSSVCTPTRYGLMTGRYSWRTSLQSGVVQGYADNLIAKDRETVASFLKAQGYHTAIIGKWHLNFNYADKDTGEILSPPKNKKLAPIGSKIPDGPTTRGFDYFHGFHHAKSMEKVIENDTVIAHDDEINMLPRITSKSVAYIHARAKDKDNRPFFLYVPYGSPHTPILPTKEWQGKSGISSYADFVMETDDGFRQILNALDQNNLTENTLVIFSADNGCSRQANFKQLASKGHYPSAGLRGSKSDLWDGGHRVPFIARWPHHIKPGTTSHQLICLTDLFATCADILNQPIPNKAAEDSVSFLPAFSNNLITSSRQGLVHHSISGHFSYRMGKWKLLLSRGSGGWSAPNEKAAKDANAPKAQLYDMEADPGEKHNLYADKPEIVASLLPLLEQDINNGRSTTGPMSKNDIEIIDLWKSDPKFYTPPSDAKKINAKSKYIDGLPHVLIIGDSISIGYTPSVIHHLKGIANVSRIPVNGGNTGRGLKEIDRWLGDTKWDIIHFNWGLHDLCYRNPNSKTQGKRDKKNGTQDVPLEQYKVNLEKLVTRLEKTGATLIWASTTYVPEEEAGRIYGDDLIYNKAAAEIMQRHNIPINDLNAYSRSIKKFGKGTKDVHYTKEGSNKLGTKVSSEIQSLIQK